MKINTQAPHNLDVDDKSMDDSQSIATTVVGNDRDDSNCKTCFVARRYNRDDASGGTEDAATFRSDCCNHELSKRDAGARQDHACETAEPEQASPRARRVCWGSVLVRDYPMILGDNPCCSGGPPLTLDWEYQEHTPLAIDEYEICHPHHRTVREMGRNRYQRKNLLTLAGFDDVDIKRAEKEIGRVRLHRSITRSVAVRYPLFKAQDAVESAGRKFRRLLKEDHWKSQKQFYSAF